MAASFIPTYKWHVKVLAALLALCAAAFFVISYTAQRVPEPYRAKTPAPETTPWLHHEAQQ